MSQDQAQKSSRIRRGCLACLGIKTDDNGYRLIVRALGVKTESYNPEFYQQQVYEKLGLDPNVKPTLERVYNWSVQILRVLPS